MVHRESLFLTLRAGTDCTLIPPIRVTLNNLKGTIVANAAIVPAGTSGEITAYANNDTDLVTDINGYFAAPGKNGLSLYPAVPCRVIDTRKVGNGQPFSGGLTVDVVGSVCGPPSTAQPTCSMLRWCRWVIWDS